MTLGAIIVQTLNHNTLLDIGHLNSRSINLNHIVGQKANRVVRINIYVLNFYGFRVENRDVFGRNIRL